MVIVAATLAAMALTACAEWLHTRRLRRVAHLAFGPRAAPARWVRLAPPARVLSVGMLVWGLATLLALTPQPAQPDELAERDFRHLVLVLDVSPSMKLRDAGPLHDRTRAERAGDAVRAILDRIAAEQVRYSVIAVYSGARRVATDTEDLAILYNILDDLPMSQAFDIGKTTLDDGVRDAVELAADWPTDSATIMIVTDGDAALSGDVPRLPPSVAQVLVLGVGNPRAGTYIDGHLSYQDQRNLAYLAAHLGGRYYDANEHHVPAAVLQQLALHLPLRPPDRHWLRTAALGAVATGAALGALLPVALALYGTQWHAALNYEVNRT